MKYILGTKEKMTQIFDESGNSYPVSVISTSPLTVTQVKTKETDGYEAVQVGFGESKKVNKPQQKIGKFQAFRECRDLSEVKVGDKIEVTSFEEGDKVKVSAVSKGKGFQGVVKRHGFAGGRRSHGQKHSEREGGSIGAGGPARVFKGLKMPGRMGGNRVSVRNLVVMKIDGDKVYLKGAVPGRTGALVEIWKQ